ncbi:hypothetical protein LPJ55_002549 [Coemansia sp. RSA 990]|nr:hypothetical protein LPJ55_002549 [Coemansia sp. RSA 990]
MSSQIAIALSTMLALTAATSNHAATMVYEHHIRDSAYIGNEPVPKYSDSYYNIYPVKYKDSYSVPEKYWGDDPAACPYHGHRTCGLSNDQTILVCKEGSYVSKRCPHGKHCKPVGDSAHCIKDDEPSNEYGKYKYEGTWPEKQWPEKQWPEKQWPEKQWPEKQWPEKQWPEKQWPEKQWPEKQHHKHHEHKHSDHHNHGHSHHPHETYINEYHITNSFAIYPTDAPYLYSEYNAEPTYTSIVYATDYKYGYE